MWPAVDSKTRRHMWVQFVVDCCLCSERFLSGYSGFPLSSKTNISKLQFDLDYQALYHEPLTRESTQAPPVLLTLNLIIYSVIFIYLFIYLFLLDLFNSRLECEREGGFTCDFRLTLATRQFLKTSRR